MTDLISAVASYTAAGVFRPASEKTQRYRSLAGRIIAIEGGIGVGKTTIGQSMANTLNECGVEAIFLEETVNEHLLKMFYDGNADKTKPNYSFAFQISMLKDCQQNYERAMWESGRRGGKQKVVIVDRTIWGNAVFAALHCDEKNINSVEFNAYLESLKKGGPYEIDHVVYLDLKPSKARKRITQRGRTAEKTCSVEYLQDLDRAYYAQLYNQIAAGHSNIIVASNDVFLDAEYALRLITTPGPGPFTFPPELKPSSRPAENIDEWRQEEAKRVREGFDRLCKWYMSPMSESVSVV